MSNSLNGLFSEFFFLSLTLLLIHFSDLLFSFYRRVDAAFVTIYFFGIIREIYLILSMCLGIILNGYKKLEFENVFVDVKH